MQEVEIPPRDSFKYYVNVTNPPATLLWNFTTKKNTIGFGLFYQNTTTTSTSILFNTSTNSALSNNTVNPPPPPPPPPQPPIDWHAQCSDPDSKRTSRIRSKSDPPHFLVREPALDPILPIKRVNSAKATIKDQQTVSKPDNTFSRNTSKKVTFFVALRDGEAIKEERTSVPDLQGWLLKKKRKRMQGWAKRYFTCDQGQVAYSKVPNGFCRGSVPLALSTISVDYRRWIINIDSGSSLWHLRALTQEDYHKWLTVIKHYKANSRSSTMTTTLLLEQTLPSSNTTTTTSNHHAQNDLIPSVEESMAGMEQAVNKFVNTLDLHVDHLARLVLMMTDPAPAPELVDTIKLLAHVLVQEKTSLMHQLSIESVNIRRNLAAHHTQGQLHHSASSVFTITPNTPNRNQYQQQSSDNEHTPTQHPNRTLLHTRRGSSTSIYDTWFDAEDLVLSVDDDDDDDSDSSETGSNFARYPEMTVEEQRSSDDEYGTGESDDESAYMIDNYAISVGAMVTPSTQTAISITTPQEQNVTIDNQLLLQQQQYNTNLNPESQLVVNRRVCLPSTVVGNEISLIGILRKNVGKDLSTVTMPISLNEPINLLQKLAEDLEYSNLLDRAAQLDDSMSQLYLVAAFAISSYASMVFRNGRKPFNPLYGETYELVRPDLGFRFVAEKVSHRPPIMACHATSLPMGQWVFTQHSVFKSKFWGKSMELIPIGSICVEFPQSGNRYTYSKITTCIRNIISGTKSLDLYGKVSIVNTKTDERMDLTFKENGGGGWLSGHTPNAANEVTGMAYSKTGEHVASLRGKWDEMCMIDHLNTGTSPPQVLWRATTPIPNCEQYYGFTQFTIGLNEITDDIRHRLPCTDTRNRPDQVLFEQGNLDLAEQEKTRLEEKQRRKRDEDAGGSSVQLPVWFEKVVNNNSSGSDGDQGGLGDLWRFTNKYWQARESGKWPPLPDLFS